MKKTICYSALFLILLTACSHRGAWRMTFCDDFDTGVLDTAVWTRIPRCGADWGRTQDDKDERLVTFRDGCIVLRGIVNDTPNRHPSPHLTGGIWSKDKHPFEVGEHGARFVVRARLHGATGAWPAIWLMPFDNGPWPTGGEIDIMERLNYDAIAHQTVHTPYTQRHGDKQHSKASPIRPDDFNEYGVDIFPDSIVFHINGTPTFTYHRDPNVPESELQFPYFRAQHFRIDQQLGGSWVGKVKDSDLPVEMEVDWVKHFLRK